MDKMLIITMVINDKMIVITTIRRTIVIAMETYLDIWILWLDKSR